MSEGRGRVECVVDLDATPATGGRSRSTATSTISTSRTLGFIARQVPIDQFRLHLLRLCEHLNAKAGRRKGTSQAGVIFPRAAIGVGRDGVRERVVLLVQAQLRQEQRAVKVRVEAVVLRVLAAVEQAQRLVLRQRVQHPAGSRAVLRRLRARHDHVDVQHRPIHLDQRVA